MEQSCLAKERNIYSDNKPLFGKRPLFFAAVLFLMGILFAERFSVSCIYSFAGSAVFIILHIVFRKFRYTGLLVLAAVMLIGAGMFSLRMSAFDSAFFAEDEIEISGRIRDVSVKDDGSAIYRLTNAKTGGTKLNTGVYVRSDDADYVLNDVVKFKGTVVKPLKKSYDFGFDDRLYCASNGVGLRMYAEESVYERHETDIFALVDTLRRIIGARMDELFKENAPLAKAMLIGVDDDIDTDTYNSYREAGISHVLCISGLHISIICFSVYQLLKRLRAGRVLRFILSALFLVCYIAIAGFKISAVRAGIMFLIFITAKTFFYNYDALTSLAAAFFSIVLFNPAAVFNIGFQLSFASVFAIFTIHGSFAGTKVQRNPFLSSFVMSAAAFLGTWLIISNINNRINLVSLLVNPPAVMITGATVPVVAAATLIYCVFGGFTVNFGYPGIFLIGITNKIAALAEKADFAVVKIPAIPPEAILASFAIIFILSKFISAKPFSKAVAAALIAVLIPVSFFAYSLGGNALRIDVLSDRFANSAVITDGSGDCWLIDAGSRSAFDYTEDYGLKPKAVFITGARSKSVGGLEYFVDSDIYAPANAISDERLSGFNIICLEGGERISLTDEISITTFADKDASHISYHIKRGENTVMTLLAVSPDDEVYRTKADVIFVNSYSKATARYVYECGPDCVIIKENGGLDADFAAPLINAVHAGRVSVLSNDKTRVVSRYEG